MLEGDPYLLSTVRTRHLPRDLDEVGEQRGTIQEIFEVRSRENERIVGGRELRRDPPIGLGRGSKSDPDRAVFEVTSPHERRRHVEVSVRSVDPGVCAVRPITEQGVREAHVPLMVDNIPLVGIGSFDRQRRAVFRQRPDIVDVLREFMERIPAG